jgi:hypothetical protein
MTSKGLSNSHHIFTAFEFLPTHHHINHQLDELVWNFYTPNLRCKTATTSLITSALFARGYLTLLFPCNVQEPAGSFSNGIRLFNLVVAQLDQSISEVANGFNEGVQGDKRYWSEAACSLAILIPGLLHAQEGLENHITQPICVSYCLPDLRFYPELTNLG